VRQSLEAADWLVAQGCEQFLFKYCSTFDSTPQGNIGPVAEALLDRLGADLAVVCPAFPATGRRLFMGHLFVGEKLLSESGMEKHPLTPMTDPNIRRWLRLQTRSEVGLVHLDTVRAGPGALADAFSAERARGVRLVVTDAVADSDLMALGEGLAGHRLVTGGSGIALGLPRNFLRAGKLAGQATTEAVARGPAVVLSGSCSTASQRQVAAYLEGHPGLAVDPQKLMDGSLTVDAAAAWVAAQDGAAPIVYSTADPSAVTGAQQKFGRAEIAGKVEHFFASLARRLANDILAIFGAGMIIGNILGAWLADRSLVGTIGGVLSFNIVVLIVFWLTAQYPVMLCICVLFIGFGVALAPAVQTRLMDLAGDAQTLAAASMHSAFNIANAAGAWLGGLAITAGYGYASTGWVGAALGLAGLIVFGISVRFERRHPVAP
jgi:uncharacterized protein YgbK (DUF1537 family)